MKRCAMITLLLVVLLVTMPRMHALNLDESFIEPVPLQDIKLEHNSQYDKALSLNREYILGIETDRLLKTFRLNSGLDAPGENLGGWEDPSVEVRGQFMGHWLSGTAMLGKYSGDKAVLDKAGVVIQELRKCQQAMKGYLSAFPTEHFKRLRNLQQVWAPFYVIHKIMAGLLDHHNFLGNKLALQMVVDEAAFFEGYVKDVYDHEGESHWVQMLEIEFGGMEEVLFNLYAATGDERWAKLAKKFTKPNFYLPLTKNEDTLPGRHANTHLAQVNGFAAGFEATGDQGRRAAASNFFDIIVGAHSYATGGNNDGEYWGPPYQLGASIAAEGAGRNTEETCTTYNMMKIARYLFRWTGDPRYADYYERAVSNGMLGSQRMPANYTSSALLTGNASAAVIATPAAAKRNLLANHAPIHPSINLEHVNHSFGKAAELHNGSFIPSHPVATNWRQEAFALIDAKQALPEDSNAPGPGVIIYLLPLGSGNTKDDSFHHWSTPLNSFWCCSGSIAESFGKIMDSIYFQRKQEGSPAELFINQLTPSSLHWKAGGLDLHLRSQPFGPHNTAIATIKVEPNIPPSDDSEEAVVKLRIPNWVLPLGSWVDLNQGEVVARNEELQPGTYLSIKRKFKSGDELRVYFNVKITTEKINDWHPEFNNLQAVILGNYLMAALTDDSRAIQADPTKVAQLVTDVSEEGLVSLAAGGDRLLCAGSKGLSLVPRTRCFSQMECTFRLLSANGSAIGGVQGSDAILESMTQPGKFATLDPEGGLAMHRVAHTDAAAWQLEPRQTNGAMGGVLRILGKPGGEASQVIATGLELVVIPALGSYPEGAKLLKGDDKDFVIAPIGHIVEERYTPYIEFTSGSRATT